MSTITSGVERYQPTLTPTEAVGAGGHNHDRASRPQVAAADSITWPTVGVAQVRFEEHRRPVLLAPRGTVRSLSQ